MKHEATWPVLLAAVLTACSSSRPAIPAIGPQGALATDQVTSQAQRSWIAHGAGSRDQLLYVVDEVYSKVAIYRQRGLQLAGAITTDLTLPTGIWVDTQRNLWVANTTYGGYSSTILRFPPGATKPDLQLTDPTHIINSIWVARDGTVYAVNSDYYGDCLIVEYAPHKKTGKVIGDSHLYTYVGSIVGDAKGDLFASGLRGPSKGGPNEEIDERAAGSKRWTDTGIAVNQPIGLGFDASGNLVVADAGYDVINTFRPGQKTPSNTIQCSNECVSFAFNRRGDRFFIDEYNGGYDTIEERAYPSGTLIGAIPGLQTDSVDSLATSPDLYP